MNLNPESTASLEPRHRTLESLRSRALGVSRCRSLGELGVARSRSLGELGVSRSRSRSLGALGVSRCRSLGALVIIAVVTSLAPPTTTAQEIASPADSLRHWYDTLEVEQPRYARATVGERLALAAFATLALPVGMVVGATTIIPPTINLLVEDKRTSVGITAGSGLGFGGDSTQQVYYPDLRVQLDIGYYFGRERPFIAHAAVMKDLWIASVHPKDLIGVGVSAGAGVATDAHTYTPYVEAWLGLLNPLGIAFAPLFPMHNYGVRARLGYNPAREQPWYELGVGITSTFGR